MKIIKFEDAIPDLRYRISTTVNYNGMDIVIFQYFNEDKEEIMIAEHMKHLQSAGVIKSLEDFYKSAKEREKAKA